MRCDDVFARMQQLLHVVSQLQLHALAPRLSSGDHFSTIYIKVKDIVMRIDEEQVTLQVLLGEVNRAAHIEVAMFLLPLRAYEAEAW